LFGLTEQTLPRCLGGASRRGLHGRASREPLDGDAMDVHSFAAVPGHSSWPCEYLPGRRREQLPPAVGAPTAGCRRPTPANNGRRAPRPLSPTGRRLEHVLPSHHRRLIIVSSSWHGSVPPRDMPTVAIFAPIIVQQDIDNHRTDVTPRFRQSKDQSDAWTPLPKTTLAARP
jgi:hypothetical protein